VSTVTQVIGVERDLLRGRPRERADTGYVDATLRSARMRIVFSI
jgi:hypothetical protein